MYCLSWECLLCNALHHEYKWLLNQISGFWSVVKPLTRHHLLLSSINHLFSSPLWQQSDSCLDAKQLRWLCHRYSCWVPSFLWKKAKFLMRLPAFFHFHRLSRLTETLASYRCWPVVLLFEMCSPCFCLHGDCDRLISPDAHSPGIKEKKKGLKGFAASLSAFCQSWNPHTTKKSISLRIKLVLWDMGEIKTQTDEQQM